MFSMSKKCLAAACALVCSVSIAIAGNKPITIKDSALKWLTLASAPKLKYAILTGDPEKTGFFIIRLKLPKDYQDIVHEHDLPRYDTIISGALFVGFGDKIDKSKTKKLPEGAFMVCPAGIKHYGFTEEETIVQIAGMGPWKGLTTASEKR